MNPLEEGGEGSPEQDVNAFTKGKGKGGYWPYQGAWNGNPSGTGYQGICWGCGEVGHQQRECPRKIQQIDCDNIECDFFFRGGGVRRGRAPANVGVQTEDEKDWEGREVRRMREGVQG